MTPSAHHNQIYFTAIPGAVFSGFTHPWNDREDGALRAAFGKLFRRDGRLFVPLGIQANHVFVDGRALGELTRRAQEAFKAPDM